MPAAMASPGDGRRAPGRGRRCAGVRRDHAEQHLHQRALAGAVLAEQAEDFAGRRRRDRCRHWRARAETTHDSAHLQQRGHQAFRPTRSEAPVRATSGASGTRKRTARSSHRRCARRSRSARSSARRVLNCAAMSSTSLTTAAGTIGLNALPASYCERRAGHRRGVVAILDESCRTACRPSPDRRCCRTSPASPRRCWSARDSGAILVWSSPRPVT